MLTFYQDQRSELLGRGKSRGDPAFRNCVHSVDSFQGSEASIVLLSFVRSTDGRTFLDEPTRLNVALTRAKELLVVFANVQALLGCGGGDGEVKQVLLDAGSRGLIVDEATWLHLIGEYGQAQRIAWPAASANHRTTSNLQSWQSSSGREISNDTRSRDHYSTRGSDSILGVNSSNYDGGSQVAVSRKSGPLYCGTRAAAPTPGAQSRIPNVSSWTALSQNQSSVWKDDGLNSAAPFAVLSNQHSRIRNSGSTSGDAVMRTRTHFKSEDTLASKAAGVPPASSSSSSGTGVPPTSSSSANSSTPTVDGLHEGCDTNVADGQTRAFSWMFSTSTTTILRPRQPAANFYEGVGTTGETTRVVVDPPSRNTQRQQGIVLIKPRPKDRTRPPPMPQEEPVRAIGGHRNASMLRPEREPERWRGREQPAARDDRSQLHRGREAHEPSNRSTSSYATTSNSDRLNQSTAQLRAHPRHGTRERSRPRLVRRSEVRSRDEDRRRGENKGHNSRRNDSRDRNGRRHRR
ncbi:unnamed protein product [Amoebophrya sp. A25]|nr:unnamed protein product [Amoebophrya sp. A25]|eukprot:GSA25T00011728001.1